MRGLLVYLFISLAACSDSTGPRLSCEAEKREQLAAMFGPEYSPTDNLLLQTHWTFGTTEVTWAKNCTATVTH